MDPICTYGSEPLPTAPEWFQFTSSFLAGLIPGPVGTWVNVLLSMGGLPAGDQRSEVFCATEILTDPATDEDWLLFTSGQIPAAILTGGFERVIGDIKRQAWAQLCQCKAPPPPDTTGEHLWQQTIGPVAPGASVSWNGAGLPIGAHITRIGVDSSPVGMTQSPSQSITVHFPWVNGDAFFLWPDSSLTHVEYTWQPGDVQIIPTGGTILGVAQANDVAMTYTVWMDGEMPAGPPYVPPTPPVPSYDPPDPTDCTLEELCELVKRVYTLDFQTLTEVLKANAALEDQAAQLTAILDAVGAVSTVVIDVQSKVESLGDRVELARADANYLKRWLAYDGTGTSTWSDEVEGEGQYNSPAPMMGLMVAVTQIPETQGHTGMATKAYYGLGYVQFVANGGLTRKYPIVSNPTIYEHAPPLCSQVYYWLAPGVKAEFMGLVPYDDPYALP